MTENERYIVKGTDDFFQHIEDTTLTEDKHEGAIYNIYQVVNLLNEQDNEIQKCKLAYNQLSSYVDDNFDEYMTQKKLNERIRELEKEVLDLRAEVGRLNSKKEVEIPHWLKYESSKGYTKKVNQDIRFDGDVK